MRSSWPKAGLGPAMMIMLLVMMMIMMMMMLMMMMMKIEQGVGDSAGWLTAQCLSN